MTCADAKPLKAEGDPVTLGAITPEGDPAGSFPEWAVGVRAAVQYINNELGGVGADYKTGKPGKPIKVDICTTAITPGDSQKCANEVAAKKPFAVIRNINFFGNDLPILDAAGIPSISASLVTAADFTSTGTLGIAGGGGCVGAHTALVDFMVNTLGKKRIAVPWADTPPGVVCYHDLETKPLNILGGKTQGPAEAYNKVPGLEHIGVPIKPGLADMTPQVTQVLDFKPDGILFSAQGADCWTLVNTLGKLGWKASETPLLMSGACIDDAKALAAGDLAKGIYFLGASPARTDNVDPLGQFEGKVMLDKMTKYGDKESAAKGFGINGFGSTVNSALWMTLAAAKAGGGADKVTKDAFVSYVKGTTKDHVFLGTPLNCAGASAPYVSVCSPFQRVTQWDGAKYVTKKVNLDATYIVKGTPIDFGK
jgi:branched-chain amino acid transport system substrate-binding protein